MNLARDMQNNKISREEASLKNNEAFEEMLEKSESIKYIDAKRKFDAMVNQVNQMLNFTITGQDQTAAHDLRARRLSLNLYTNLKTRR